MSLVGCYLSPRHLEGRFWASSFCHHRLVQQERWGIATAAVMFAVQAAFLPQKVSSPAFKFIMATGIPVLCIRFYFAFLKPQIFLRFRCADTRITVMSGGTS
jgi:hypothetical protein